MAGGEIGFGFSSRSFFEIWVGILVILLVSGSLFDVFFLVVVFLFVIWRENILWSGWDGLVKLCVFRRFYVV